MQRERADDIDASFDMRPFNKKAEAHPSPREFTLRIPLLFMAGFSLYLGWIFCLFWSPSLFPAAVWGSFEIHAVRMGMTVAMFASYVACGLFARFFASTRGETVLRLVALFGCPCACVAGVLPVSVSSPLVVALWAASGVGSSALLLVWSKKIGELSRKQVIFTMSGAFLVGSFLFAATAFMPGNLAFLATGSIPIASVVVAFVAASPTLSFSYDSQVSITDASDASGATGKAGAKTVPSDDREDDESEGEPQRIVFMRTILLAFAYSISIGFVGSCATAEFYYPFSVYVIAAGNVFAALFTVLYLVRKPRNIAIVLTEVFLPVMLLCIFVFSFANYAGQLVCIMAMLALLACHDIVDVANVSKSSRLFDENYVKTFAVGRTFNGLGCSLGWATGMAVTFLPNIGLQGRLFICFALVVFLVVITSFAVFHPGPLSYVREVRMEAERPFSAVDAPVGGDLELKSRSVAARYGLTARQAEVMLCLAQGRNAGHIAQKFTISTHTAKSHIYNIYNKLGIHSQQELLDIVDAEDVSSKEEGAGKTADRKVIDRG